MTTFKQFLETQESKLQESKFPLFPDSLRFYITGLTAQLDFNEAIDYITNDIKSKLNDDNPNQFVARIISYTQNDIEHILKPSCEIYLVQELEHDSEGTSDANNQIGISKKIQPERIKTVLLHELFHILDPKTKIKSFQTEKTIDPKTTTYHKSPLELDANSAVLNTLIKNKINDSQNKEKDIEELEHLIRIGITTENIADFLNLPQSQLEFIDKVRKHKWKLFNRLVSRMDNLLQSLKTTN